MHNNKGLKPDVGFEGVGSDMELQWSRVLERLKTECEEGVFNSWFKPLALVNVDEGCAVMAAPTRFMRNWLQSNYAERIRQAWSKENPDVTDISIIVLSGFKSAEPQGTLLDNDEQDEARPSASERKQTAAGRKPKASGETRVVQNNSGTEFGAPLDPRFTFDSFVVGKSNELAYAAARRVAENTAVHFNPLFLHGGVGLGKTHLMHAIAWANKQMFPERRVLYLSAEQFMYQFISSIRFKDTMSFKQKFRSVDLLMIDDLQFIANKESTQEEFFHTFNALIDHHHQVVISADRSPTDLEGIEERIRSRLGWGLVADIHPTDYELRLGILQQKANSVPEVEIQTEVLEFLAKRITSNVRELEGALNRMVAHATLIGRPITMEMTQEVLQDLLRANDRRVTIDEIQRRVADYFNIRLSDLLSSRRARQVARPRQIAMYLAKEMTSKSLPEIGRKFGGRDHTTVMHAVKRIDELRQTDSVLEEDILHLERIFST
ncbi:chromosomal replication initiator protein DnaA [Emcibacter nanhaiensis]|uniref:Chromosomal replication initiator protein DnaA n=1 Tax=Emcibacter nanhaiensis TaxID=1505037 RepID=A0A501PLV8_9PROT|nr:chromosomal replication initiator protein DnaA [Emcibacter nanhaiensis]TPD61500.1 chromosomal replication initiator protein DnaA [Emcibacter nanhaiensis]